MLLSMTVIKWNYWSITKNVEDALYDEESSIQLRFTYLYKITKHTHIISV